MMEDKSLRWEMEYCGALPKVPGHQMSVLLLGSTSAKLGEVKNRFVVVVML